MAEDTFELWNDMIITDILDSDITSEEYSILLDKSSSSDVSNKDFEHLSNNNTNIFKPIRTSDWNYKRQK